MKKNYIIEACVDSLKSAKNAEKCGADQIELCAHLDLGGTTPTFTLIKQVKSSLKIPIKVMIRPRGGDFYYSDDEVEDMIDSISKCRYLDVAGVVLGATTTTMKKLDMELLEELAAVAYPLDVTVHKVIDECSSPVKEIKRLKKIKNITSVLSSGKDETALEGSEMLKKMIIEGGDKITIIAAGKITSENLSEVHQSIGGTAYHGRKII
ncbi:MAG: copper homeostasis protein CutC [Saprospiraceae bacterium]